MRLFETCVCGAAFTVEDDEASLCVTNMSLWRERHQCPGYDPMRRNAGSMNPPSVEFGFSVEEEGDTE